MRSQYKTARCILYRNDEFLLAVHGRFWRARNRRWGLPGGQIEQGESPEIAVARELEEELQVVAPRLTEVGAYEYKNALHMVYAAPLDGDVRVYDERELLDIRWFSEGAVAALKADLALHADYELEAIRSLQRLLRPRPATAAAPPPPATGSGTPRWC